MNFSVIQPLKDTKKCEFGKSNILNPKRDQIANFYP